MTHQCVPDLLQDLPVPSIYNVEYEVAELTWENGQLSMHDLGIPRVHNKPPAVSSPAAWDKPCAGGTLESIVNQANCHTQPKFAEDDGGGDDTEKLVPWFEQHGTAVKPAAAASTMMDALVPSDLDTGNDGEARVGLNSGCRTNGSMRESNTCGGSESQHVTRDRWMENTTSGGGGGGGGQGYTKTCTDDHDSISHRKSQRKKGDVEGKSKLSIGQSSGSTKRSRAAAIHNQSERKRRDKINQRMKTLQKMVPNSSKTDKASMLDEVIEYMKQLQAQVSMMSRTNMSSMMLPLLQQQLQMSMMGMGMGMGVMDMNTINRAAAAAAVPPVIPPSATFTPTAPPGGPVMPDPLAALLAYQSQPMNMDAYSRLAAIFQQLQQPPASKN